MRRYRIKGGCSFRVSETKLKTGGDIIDLEDDVARVHADKIDLLPDDEQVAVVVVADTGEPEHF